MKFPYTPQDIERIAAQQSAESNDPPIALFFCGFGHSGHSLVGALIDAHPHALVANELNVLRAAVELGLDRHQCLALMSDYARRNRDDSAWVNTGYRYRIEGHSQGTFTDQLRVVGDKKAGGTARAITAYPQLIDLATALFGDQLRVIFPVRNPFDNIAAAAFRRQVPLDEAVVDQYFLNADAALKWRSALSADQYFVLAHEAFVDEPEKTLQSIGRLLGLGFSDELLSAAREKTHRTPNPRRSRVTWSPQVVKKIAEEMRKPHRAPLFERYDDQP